MTDRRSRARATLALLVLAGLVLGTSAGPLGADEPDAKPARLHGWHQYQREVLRAQRAAPRRSAEEDEDDLLDLFDLALLLLGGEEYAVVNVECVDAASADGFALLWEAQHPGCVLVHHHEFLDLFVPDETPAWSLLETSPLVRHHELYTWIRTPPPEPVGAERATTRGLGETIVRGGFTEDGGPTWTGQGVLVAIVDDGVDFRHPDFVRHDGAGRPVSRIRRLWDVTKRSDGLDWMSDVEGVHPAPYAYPGGEPIGLVYDRDYLTRVLQQEAGLVPAEVPAPGDLLGGSHGTACASVAAGNGNASGGDDRARRAGTFAGAAPEADLLVVRIGEGGRSLGYAWMMGAIGAWLDGQATEAGLPLVVSCSWGGQAGGHDGDAIRERHLAARFPPSARGRALCISAGNEGERAWHADREVTGAWTDSIFRWTLGDVPSDLPENRRPRVEVYVDTSEVAFLTGDEAESIRWRNLNVPGAGETRLRQVEKARHPISGDLFLVLEIQSGGPGGIALRNEEGFPVEAHAYLYGASVQSTANGSSLVAAEFDPGTFSRRCMVGTPGGCATAITVGSYDFNDRMLCRDPETHEPFEVTLSRLYGEPALRLGALSSYSSPGPMRGGVPKPEAVAPGCYHLSAFPVTQDEDVGSSHVPAPSEACASVGSPLNTVLTGDRRYAVWSGTSAATPYVAGVLALVLQKNPDLTLGQVRELLAASLTRRNLVGNPTGWGGGRLDLPAVARLLRAVPRR